MWLALLLETGGSIHPELTEASPWLRETVEVSQTLMDRGIDPGMALAAVASVPVILRGMKMANEWTSAMIVDWKEMRQLERERTRMEMKREFSDLPGHGDP